MSEKIREFGTTLQNVAIILITVGIIFGIAPVILASFENAVPSTSPAYNTTVTIINNVLNVISYITQTPLQMLGILILIIIVGIMLSYLIGVFGKSK